MKSALDELPLFNCVVALIVFILHTTLFFPSIDPLRSTAKGTEPSDSLMWNSEEARPM